MITQGYAWIFSIEMMDNFSRNALDIMDNFSRNALDMIGYFQ